jgi:membrane-associated phospholipid phosphatase
MSELTNKQPGNKMQDVAQKVAKAETTSAPSREYRTVLFRVALVLTVVAFAVLTLLVEATPSFPIDLQITRALQSIRSPLFATTMRLVSWPGFPPQSFILSALIIVLMYILGLHWETVATTVAALLPALVNVLVKQMVGRPRPSVDLVNVFRILNDYSFPSGHVMFYVGFFGFLWFLVYTIFRHSVWRTLLLIFLGILIALIGVSRVYLGQHWASDVLGAYLLGSVTLAVNFLIYRWGKKRFFVHQPVAEPDPADVEKTRLVK